ncbi:MAG: hypothetical protein U1A78_32300 [Polyangia bacterium]
MAWPKTPLTTYVGGNTPALKAFDNNAYQAAINGIINGTYSLLGLVLDGTGGAVVTPVAGAATVSALLTGTAKPTTAYSAATVGVGTVCSGWARITGAGALLRGFNVLDVGRTAAVPTGGYDVTFHGKRTDADNLGVWVSVVDNGVPAFACFQSFAVGANQVLRIRVYDLTGTLTDRAVACGFLSE